MELLSWEAISQMELRFIRIPGMKPSSQLLSGIAQNRLLHEQNPMCWASKRIEQNMSGAEITTESRSDFDPSVLRHRGL